MAYQILIRFPGDTYKEGVHSLERHTNLYIYFDKNPYQ